MILLGADVYQAANKLQEVIGEFNIWTKKWRIELNEQKSSNISFTNKKNQENIPVVVSYENKLNIWE